jgi:two-component system phosphate regulon response regulator PhoB
VRKKILVVDDDPDILTLVQYNLEKDGYAVALCDHGSEALEKVGRENPDCLVLDIMLPGMDGREICRLLRTNPLTRKIPVLMLTAKSEETDIVVGLELGADDYLTKPFSPRVLLARVKALVRRSESAPDSSRVTRVGPFSIDSSKKEILAGAKPVSLTATEYHLFSYLASRPGRVFSRDELLNSVWEGGAAVTDRTVDVHMVSLRKKLGRYADAIETVRGFGYRFSEKAGPE